MASLALRDDDFAWITAEVVALGLPTVSVRKGGYNPTPSPSPSPSPSPNPNPNPNLKPVPNPARTRTRTRTRARTPSPTPNQVLEGGYNLGALSRGVRCHLHALIHGHGDE